MKERESDREIDRERARGWERKRKKKKKKPAKETTLLWSGFEPMGSVSRANGSNR